MSVGFTDFGLGLCAAGFTALAIALRPGVATGMPRMKLRLAALFMVLWALAAGFLAHRDAFDPALALLFSLSLISMWIWQLAQFARWQGQPRLVHALLEWSGAAVLAVTVAWMLLAERLPGVPPPTVDSISVLGLLLSIFGLSAIEQLYRNAPHYAQPAMRWLSLGMGGVLLTELVAFAQTLLVGGIAATPGPLRGFAYAFCSLAMMRGARRMPQWQFGLSVSRHVVFYAASFLLVGGYLMLMALAGWLILGFAGGWNPVAELAFAALAGLGFTISLFSGPLFRWLKVQISSHLYPHHYDYRREWMRFTRKMSETDSGADVSQRAIQALAQIIGSPGGSLWRVESGSGRYKYAACWPANPVSAPADLPSMADADALPAYLQRTAWLVDLAEFERSPDLYGELRIDAAALGASPDALIVPLLHVDLLYGWIVLVRAPGKDKLDFEDRDLLKIAGRQIAAHLAQADAALRLAEVHQFETYNRMTAFVMHDLKNIAAQLRLISQNAERHRKNSEFVEDSFRTVASAAARMSKLIAQLASGGEGGTLQTLDLATCAERAALRCSGSTPVPQIIPAVRPRVLADLEQLTNVIEHAIRNAQEATPTSGEIRVEIGMRERRPLLAVVDTGCGMDAQFVRERLFRPFDTTKGPRGMGIGAFQIREYLRSLGGDVEVRSEPGKGTQMTLVFADQSILSMGRLAAEGGRT